MQRNQINAVWAQVLRRPRWEQVAVAVWLTILLVVCLRCLVSSQSSTVYPIFAQAARNWLDGTDLYSPGHDPYRYSPFVTTDRKSVV